MLGILLRYKFIVIIVAALVALGAWYGLSSPSSSPDLVTTPVPGSLSSGEQDLISTLLALRTVKLDGTIFSDPVFVSLKDFSTEIVAEPVGRDNPFAPLQAAASASASSTKSAQIFSPRR